MSRVSFLLIFGFFSASIDAINVVNLQNFAAQNPRELERTIVSLENPYIASVLVSTNGAILNRPHTQRRIPIQFNEPLLDSNFQNYLLQNPFLSVTRDELGPDKTYFTFEDLIQIPKLAGFLEQEYYKGTIKSEESKRRFQKIVNTNENVQQATSAPVKIKPPTIPNRIHIHITNQDSEEKSVKPIQNERSLNFENQSNNFQRNQIGRSSKPFSQQVLKTKQNEVQAVPIGIPFGPSITYTLLHNSANDRTLEKQRTKNVISQNQDHNNIPTSVSFSYKIINNPVTNNHRFNLKPTTPRPKITLPTIDQNRRILETPIIKSPPSVQNPSQATFTFVNNPNNHVQIFLQDYYNLQKSTPPPQITQNIQHSLSTNNFQTVLTTTPTPIRFTKTPISVSLPVTSTAPKIKFVNVEHPVTKITQNFQKQFQTVTPVPKKKVHIKQDNPIATSPRPIRVHQGIQNEKPRPIKPVQTIVHFKIPTQTKSPIEHRERQNGHRMNSKVPKPGFKLL